jgi:outer membrane receptor protein involved in Fe transport
LLTGTTAAVLLIYSAGRAQQAASGPATNTPGSPPSAAAAQAGQAGNAPEEIVVTAAKRSEKLQNVAEGVTVLTSRSLENQGNQNLTDIATLIPNVAVSESVAPGYGTIILRGLNSGAEQVTSTTGYYIGEVPLISSGEYGLGSFFAPNPDLVDFDRIEVLKGPQGTLYGASALGGLIRAIPSTPNTSTYSGNIRVSGITNSAGGLGDAIRGSVNLPLVPDKFAVLISAVSRRDPGYTTNVFTGHDHLGQTNTAGVAGTAYLRVNDEIDVSLRGLLQNAGTDGQLIQENVENTDQPLYGERAYSAPTDGGLLAKQRLGELTAHYTPDLGTLTASVSHSTLSLDLKSDATAYYGAAIAAFAPPGFMVSEDAKPENEKSNAEIRFASRRIGNFEFLGGFYYTSEHSNYPISILGQFANGTSLPFPLGSVAIADTPSTYEEKAVYGNATYYFTDQLDLTGGLRYSSYTQTAKEISPPGIISLGNYTLPTVNADDTQFQVTGRWRPTEDASLYVRVASGYRPGGPTNVPNPPPGVPHSYQPDTVIDYEGGIKGRLLDGRLSYDADVYYIDWSKVQLNSLVGGVIITGNGGAASVRGAEAQLSYSDPSGLVVGAAFGYNDARLDAIGASTGAALGAVAGDRLPGSPRISFSANADYSWDIFDDITASVGTTVRYQGNKVSSYSEDPLNSFYTIPAYTQLDLRGSLQKDRYTLRFNANNVTDTNGYGGYQNDRILPIPTKSTAYVITPATYILTLAVSF